jgi:hypothetical protein
MAKKWWQKESALRKQYDFKEIQVPDFSDLGEDERHEIRLIGEEMAYVLIYRLIQDLSEIEKLIIRHQFGLPKAYSRGEYYEVKSRLQLAQELEGHEYFKSKKHKNDSHDNGVSRIRREIKKIREEALKKMFCQLWYNGKVKAEIEDIKANSLY